MREKETKPKPIQIQNPKLNRKLKRNNSYQKLVLGHVIGLTAKNANGFDSNECSNICVYIAGCVVVVFDVGLDGSQSSLMVTNRTPKPLSCVAVSKDGRIVAAGESGDQAAVLVWDCTTSVLLSELKSHQHGVECIAFSPDGKLLVSIGFPIYGYICLWDWGSGSLISRLKACPSCSSVESVCFSSDANFIVTAGKKHLKIWKIISSARTRASLEVKSLSMHGKPINLGNQKGYSFIAVKSLIKADNNVVNFGQTCETSPIYCLADAGVLCLVSGSKIKKSVDIKVKKAFGLSVSCKMIACACNNGAIKLFTTDSLDYIGTLRHNEWEKCEKEDDIDSHGDSCRKDLKLVLTLPHAIACQFATSEKLVVVYGDNSIYIWDIGDLQKATGRQVFVSHNGCILDIKCLPCEIMHDPSLACESGGCSGGTSFATCSEDGTVKIWNLSHTVSSMRDESVVRNKNSNMTKQVEPTYSVSSEIFKLESQKVGVSAPEFRSMAISSDAKYLVLSDMAINPTTEVIVTVSQDKMVNIFSSDTGRFIRSFKEGGDFGDAIKVTVDRSSSFLVCSYSDRSICIYDLLSGEIAARAVGHGDVVTAIIFLHDLKHIVSASSDGCIFVWRLPTVMSSKMLQKIKEMPLSPPPPSNVQPQIEFSDDAHQFKFNPEEVTQIESSTPVVRRYSCQEVGPQEFSVFKFSISRLPRWAQARTINPVVIPDNEIAQQIGNSSPVGSHDCSNLQTPSTQKQDSGKLVLESISKFSSNTNTSQASRSPHEAHRTSFALDGRWLTIHTVCLDLQTSPGVCDMKMMMNAPTAEVPEPVQSETVEICKQAMVDINSSHMKLQVKDKSSYDLSNLSARPKPEKRNFLAKRSTLKRFALQQDLKGQKNQIDNSKSKLEGCPTMNQQERSSKQFEEPKAVIACKEALLNMETAVDNAFHLFSKLKNIGIREDWREFETGLFGQAAEILPSIAMKVNAVNKLVECSYRPHGKTEEGILSFDPLLRENNECCLQSVVEAVKKG